MQDHRFYAFFLLLFFTALMFLDSAHPKFEAHAISIPDVETSTIKPEEEVSESSTEDEKSEPVAVTLSAEAQLTEFTTSKGSNKDVNVTTQPSGSISQYVLTNKDGVPCILLQVDATVTFVYRTKSGEDRDGYEYVPDDVITSGDCREQDTAILQLKWKSYVFKWSFAKSPGREIWYVNGIKLSLNAAEKPFQNINKPGPRLLSTAKGIGTLFPTPVGKSYSCQGETSVELYDGDMRATVFLRGFKLEPFTEKKEFGPVYECSPGGGRAFRDETAPIAVGSTLAIVVLLTVTGYGVYRYFKIKKVQYDTME